MLKAAGEDAVRRCGVAWTILQPAIYAQTVSHMIVGPDDEVAVPWDPEAPMAPSTSVTSRRSRRPC